MSSSQIPSPSRSQGGTVKATSPSRRKSRRTRSVSSRTSNISLGLTAVIPDSFPTSPLPTRCSVLNDDTDIQIHGRQNWWKRLTVNSRRVTDVMGERGNEATAAEEFDVEILSQEKENMSLNLPESSDEESIHSIVLAQRELFKNRDNRPKKKLKEIINRKETLGKMQKTFFDQTNVDKDIDVMPKKLFNRVPKPKTKSVFNAALFNASPNKTVNVNNSIEKPAQEVQGPVRNIFGYRPGIKRKNIYAELVLSDSDDEFSEIQPRIFGFQTKKDHQEASKQRRLSSRSSVYSSASNITDVEIGEWNHLPSSTMVDHQFEEAGGTTPTKRIRLSRSRKSKDALNKNNSLNTSRRSSRIRSNSKVCPEVEEMNINSHSQSFNKSKNKSQVEPKSINSYVETNKTNSVRESSQKNSSKFTHKVSIDETLTEEDMQVDLVNAEHENTLTEEYQHGQVDNDNFTLEFEDDEQIFDINVKNFKANQNISNKTDKHSQETYNPHIASEIIESANVEIHSNQTDEIHSKKDTLKSPEAVLHEKTNGKESYSVHVRNTSKSKDSYIASEVIESANVETHSNQTDEILTKKDILKSPKVVLHEKTNGKESYSGHVRNTSMNKDSHIISEIIESANVERHSNQTDEIHRKKDILKSPEAVLHEKTNGKESYSVHVRNTSKSKDSYIASEIIESANVEIHSKQTDEIYRKKDILKSPEAVLHEKTNGEESYTAHGRNTSMSKSKTLPKDLNIRTSLASARESSGFTDGTICSSSECSVWDSHRTTRQTLRQTFGKDFTPRKSLRTLVMERAAKRQTNYNQNQDQVADKSGLKADADQSKHTITSYSKVANKSKDKSTRRTCLNKIGNLNQSKRKTDFDENHTRSNQEIDKNEKVECNEENKQNEEPDTEQNLNVKFGGESKQNEEFESDPKTVENVKSVSAIDLQPNEESELVQNEGVESDKESKQYEEPESDEDIELYEKSESEKDVSQNEGIESDAESESFNEQEQNVESELEQNEEDESEAESDRNEESESCDEQERNVESDLEQNEESESSNEQEQSEEFESYREPESLEVEKMADEADHEAARRLRQANLEKYLQKVKEESAELRRKVREKVLNSLKVPPKPFSLFKVPEIPKQKRAPKIIKKAPKPKLKSTMFTNVDHLPAEFLEDLKYKPPKRFQGRNAPWITKRLYKFLEDKLQPKYDYHARVRAEKLVEKLYLFVKDVRKCARAAPQEAVWELKLEMARLGIVTTHHEFYHFFHEFMPREVRIRVNPDILNKIPLPRNVFGDIMEE